jgi:hypothetical protein
MFVEKLLKMIVFRIEIQIFFKKLKIKKYLGNLDFSHLSRKLYHLPKFVKLSYKYFAQ